MQEKFWVLQHLVFSRMRVVSLIGYHVTFICKVLELEKVLIYVIVEICWSNFWICLFYDNLKERFCKNLYHFWDSRDFFFFCWLIMLMWLFSDELHSWIQLIYNGYEFGWRVLPLKLKKAHNIPRYVWDFCLFFLFNHKFKANNFTPQVE